MAALSLTLSTSLHFPKSLRSLPLLALLRRPLSAPPMPLLRRRPISITRSFSSTSATTSVSDTEKAKFGVKERLEWVTRTALCGELGEGDVGRRVRLCGWVGLHRVHGGLTFINLRDHSGSVQATTLPDKFPDAHHMANELRLEYVVALEGLVQLRPSESVNELMKTGKIEVAVEHVQVLNVVRSKLPFLVTTSNEAKDAVKEEIRLRYRCLDLRRHQMNSSILLRHKVVKLIRRYLEDAHNFVEIETPILCRSTPEGARDYLVPSRIQESERYRLHGLTLTTRQLLEHVISGICYFYFFLLDKLEACLLHNRSVLKKYHMLPGILIHLMLILKPGTFYALPQSPQLYKQMLMVSGFDKHYQIA